MGQGLKVETGPRERERERERGKNFGAVISVSGGAQREEGQRGSRMDLKTIPYLGASFYI
jgi:hypothetical protein